MFVVGFTGTRQGPTPVQHKAMRWFLAGIPMERFVHGGAKGCDTLAHYAVRERRQEIPIDVYPAPFDQGSIVTGGDTRFTNIHEPAPPLERNKLIVSLIHGLLAVPATDEEEIRSGTWTTVRYAREIGCPVYVVRKNGKVVRFA